MARSGHVLCFISAKGGSGKTVTAASLGTLLSGLGLRVLLIDTDAATNGLTLLFLEQLLQGAKALEGNHGLGLFEALADSSPTIIEVSSSLSFVPAAFKLRNTEEVPPERFRWNLENLLRQTQDFDIVLVDAQAGTDAYAQFSASLSDVHIIVSEYDPVSAQGIDRLKLIFADEMRPASTFTEFAAAIGEGLKIARYLPPIPWDADVVRAFARRDVAISLESPNAYTLAISQVALACLSDVSGALIEHWRGGALQRQTDPVRRRLDELYRVRESLISTQRATLRWRILSRALPALGLLVLSMLFLFGKAFPSTLGRVFDTLPLDSVMVLLSVLVTGWIFSDYSTSQASMHLEGFAGLENEVKKLETSLAASEATLRVEEPGPFAALRRRSLS